MKKWTLTLMVCALAVGAVCYWAPDRFAQEPEKKIESQNRLLVADTTFGPRSNINTMMTIARYESYFNNRLVKDAPFSAQAVTESVQTLVDGNRIVSKSTTGLYRDAEGRTRQERSNQLWAAPADGQEQIQQITIVDHVAAESISLHPASRTATKSATHRTSVQGISNSFFGVATPGTPTLTRVAPARPTANNGASTPVGGPTIIPPAGPVVGSISTIQADPTTVRRVMPGGPAGSRVEVQTISLGTQMIDGVEAEGQRTIQTIPAGVVGNERPLEIVSETWYSPELQVVVLGKTSDPRTGEVTYKLTNINRNEPEPSLFQIPSDYKLQDLPFPQPLLQPLRKPAPAEQKEQ
ncbi:MAG TPA: hypothetical protein VJ302_00370 [Blastocatellia bacterium]|nr:hypothetical protein [Blastocatellia bacterium]